MSTQRFARAVSSLAGLATGDAIGEQCFLYPSLAMQAGEDKPELAYPAAPWAFTDDTEMALSIVSVLRQHGAIDQNLLAKSFGRHYHPERGYGRGIQHLLAALQKGESWQHRSGQLFSGQGSYGNGAAMRVGPLGAYFADALDLVVREARLSAEVTHAHLEGIAGAIAVAVAAAWSWRLSEMGKLLDVDDFLDQIIPLVPESEVRTKLVRAQELPKETTIQEAGAVLGNGSQITAQDTIPFTLWCAGRYLNNYEQAIWHTMSALGDIDTNCAIVGSIVVLYTGPKTIPTAWSAAVEPLPDWFLKELL